MRFEGEKGADRPGSAGTLGFAGRSAERRRIEESLAGIARGERGLIAVGGPAGIGKSSLVRQALASPAAQGLLVLEVKHESGSDKPFGPLAKLFTALAFRTLAGEREEAETWATRFAMAARVLGKEAPTLLPLAAAEEGQVALDEDPVLHSRRVADSLARLISSYSAGLVIFVDDLQWADPASLELYSRLIDRQPRSSLLIFTLRSDGSDAGSRDGGQGFAALLEAAAAKGAIFLELLALDSSGIEEGLSSAYPGLEEVELRSLASRLFGASGGNPFYLVQILKGLVDGGLLRSDPSRGLWLLSSEAGIDFGEVPVDVTVFIATTMLSLPEAERRALASLSSFSRPFTAADLAALPGRGDADPEAVLAALLGRGYLAREPSPRGQACRFAHDNLRAAAATLLAEEERERLNAAIALAFFDDNSGLGPDFGAFDLAEHLRLGAHRLAGGPAWRRSAETLLDAGRRALASGAFAPAWAYLEAGLGLLPPDPWNAERRLCRDLHIAAAAAAFLCGKKGDSASLVDILLARAASRLEAAPAIELRIQTLMASNRPWEAARIALESAAALGLRLPRRVLRKGKVPLWLDLGLRLALYLPEGLIVALARKSKPAVSARMRILDRGYTGIFVSRREVLPLVSAVLAWESIIHGLSEAGLLGMCMYGAVLCAGGGRRVVEGYRWARLARKLASSRFPRSCQVKIEAYAAVFVAPWLLPLSRGAAGAMGGLEAGLEAGDYETAGVCSSHFALLSSLYCPHLRTAMDELGRLVERLAPLGQGRSLLAFKRAFQAGLNLAGGGSGSDPTRLSGPQFDEEAMLPILEEARDRSAILTLRYLGCLLSAAFGDWVGASSRSDEAEEYRDALGAQTYEGGYGFLRGLVLAVALQEGRAGRAALAELGRRIADLRRWALGSPGNFSHRLALLLAERRRVLGRPRGAERLFEKAIEGARTGGLRLEEALAEERYADFLAASGNGGGARIHLARAHDVWAAWGANAKVTSLESLHPWLFDGRSAVAEMGGAGMSGFEEKGEAKALGYFAETAELIYTGDSSPEALLERALRHALLRSGADRGALVGEEDGDCCLAVAGESTEEGLVTRVLPPASCGSTAMGSAAALIGFARRTGRRVDIEDSTKDGLLGFLPRPSDREPSGPDPFRSALCTPLTSRGKARGFLLLESDSSPGAFTGPMAGTIAILVAQAGMVIEAALARRLRESLAQRREGLLRENRLAALGALAAEVAHEINAPNHVIRLNAGLLERAQVALAEAAEEGRKEDREVAREELRRALDRTLAASRQIEAITANLKGIVRSGEGKERVELNGIVESTLAVFGSHFRLAAPRLELSLEPGLPALRANRGQLQQVLVNLVENACKALSGPEDAVWISTSFDPDSEELVLAVDDEGRGIDERHLARLTEPYFTTRPAEGGSGLGLYIATSIAKDHGGRLRISARSPRGTRVELRLPRGE